MTTDHSATGRRWARIGGLALVCALIIAPAGAAGAKQCTQKGTRHDDILKGTKKADVLCGKGGDDVLLGKGGDDVLKGSKGDDTLLGKGGADTLQGGGGEDELVGGTGADRLGGQGGADTASFADSAASVTVSLETGAASGESTDSVRDVERVIGSPQDDTLLGDGAANVLSGGEGADTLSGGGDDDRLQGQGGTDVATYAGSSNGITADLRAGTAIGDGTDALTGIENVIGSPQDDTLAGDAGASALTGGRGLDTASYASAPGPVGVDLGAGTASGDGADILAEIEGAVGSSFADTLTGDSGNNHLDGGEGADTLAGGPGDDQLEGSGDGDTTTYTAARGSIEASLSTGSASGEGIDSLAGIENLTGSAQDDTLEGDSGVNAIDGGAGTDAVSYEHATSAVSVDLGAGTASGAGTDTVTGVEDAIGSPQGDSLRGSGAANAIDGGDGADSLVGADGNDRLSGQAGNDQLFGEPGDDALAGGDGDDTLDGGPGTNVCDGGPGANALAGNCDPAAPLLTGFTATPASINTNAAARTLDFSLVATDTVTGLDPTASEVVISGPDGQQRGQSTLTPSGGTAFNGTYTASIIVPRFAPQGTWTIGLDLHDQAGNSVTWSSSQLIAGGYLGTFNQTGAGDTAAPLLTAFSGPTSIDTSGSAQALTFNATVTDDLSGVGVAASTVSVFAPDGSPRGEASLAPVAGDAYNAVINLPRYSPQGAWTVRVVLVDQAGNSIAWGSSLLNAAGFSFGFDQTGPGDGTAPNLTAFAITPTQINTSANDQLVTFDLSATDDFAGVNAGASNVVVIKPNGQIAAEVPLTPQGGTALNGTYRASYTVVEGSAAGTWTVEVHLVDLAGNELILDSSQLDPSGFQNAIGFPT